MRYFRLHIIEVDGSGIAKNKGAILDTVDCDETDSADRGELSRFLSRAINDSMRRILEAPND